MLEKHILVRVMWNKKGKKVKMYVYSPDISRTSEDCALITRRYWNSLFYNRISMERMQRIFCSWSHSHNFNFSFHLVPITAGWTEAVWIQSLPKAFTRDKRCGIEHRTSWSRVQQINHCSTRSIYNNVCYDRSIVSEMLYIRNYEL